MSFELPATGRHSSLFTRYVNLIDFILNCACLLLWLNWRASSMPDHAALPGKSLTATLRRASNSRSSGLASLLMLFAILFVRAFFFRQIGPALNWTAILDAQVCTLSFSTHFLDRMLLHSFLSFGQMLLIGLAWLALLSALHPGEPAGSVQRMIAWQFGRFHRWPVILKCLLPFLLTTLVWAMLSWRIGGTLYLPKADTTAQFWKQAASVGVCIYLAWLPLISLLMILHIVESYVYLGRSSFWDFVSASSRTLLAPLRKLPLRAGPVDFAPALLLLLAMALQWFAAPWISAVLRKAAF